MNTARIVRFGLAMIAFALGAGMSPLRAQTGTLTTLYRFTYNSDGAYPVAGLIQARDGNFYGATTQGGTYPGGATGYGQGTLFKITPQGQLTVLHTFGYYNSSNPTLSDGDTPMAGLVQGKDGNFYGTTYGGGVNDRGTVFKMTPAGAVTLIHSFTGGPDGANPQCTLVPDSSGTLYGTTQTGGQNSKGVVFKIKTDGEYTVLHAFSGYNSAMPALSDGDSPYSGLTLGADGNFYGTTVAGGQYNAGAVYRVTPQGALTLLSSFAAGSYANGTPLALGNDGNFYGTVESEFYRITPSGTFTDLLNATGSVIFDTLPCSQAGLIQAGDGNFYGTLEFGGLYGSGAVYRVTPNGVFTVIYAFTGSTDSYSPYGPLVQGSDGDFYGTTLGGAETDYGTIFRIHFLNPTPVLTKLSPSTLPAGGPGFTLTVSGKSFVSGAEIRWNGAPMTTKFVSANQLTASIPASAIAAAGSASVTVVNPVPGGGSSAAMAFTVTVTELGFQLGKPTRSSTTGVLTVPLTLRNIGHADAPAVTITAATLSQAGTTLSLPLDLGTLAVGAGVTTPLTFPGSAGSSGTSATLRVSGNYTGGTFNVVTTVKLP
jgi:uncharacterized repeat protein (TIGR03803 family)